MNDPFEHHHNPCISKEGESSSDGTHSLHSILNADNDSQRTGRGGGRDGDKDGTGSGSGSGSGYGYGYGYGDGNGAPQYVTLATCNLDQWAMDFEGNYERIKKSVAIAKQKNARYRVGPELEVTGYGCEDHFTEMDTFEHSLEVLSKLLTDGSTQDCICDFGLPIMHKNVRYNCRVICLDGKILCIRPKQILAGDGNYREPRYFARWSKPRTVEMYVLPLILIRATNGQRSVPFGDCAVQTLDTMFSSETCEELFAPDSPHSYLGLAGVEILSNGSGSHHQLRKLHQRLDLIRTATSKGGGVYLYANQMGCDGSRLLFDGCALIAVNGDIVAQGSQFALTEVEVVTATVDLEAIRGYRCYRASRGVQAANTPAVPRVHVTWKMSSRSGGANGKTGTRRVPATPSLPKIKYFSPEEEIAYGPAAWLWDYLRRSGASGFFLPLSGGADSASTATIVGSMCNMVAEEAKLGNEQVIADARRMTGQPENSMYLPTDPKEFASRIFHTGYLGSSNSSETTKTFAKDLAGQIGSYHLSVNIDPVIEAIVTLFQSIQGTVIVQSPEGEKKQIQSFSRPKYKVHGGTRAENLALQNIQARFRMVLSYLLAQLLPWARGVAKPGYLLVLGSANVDEGLRGYLTKYDCSSADINPIGGISKADLKRFLYWAGQEHNLGYEALLRISVAPPTAELEPITDDYIQSDEQDMGMTYEELTIYGRLRKMSLCGPVSMFNRLIDYWPNLSAREIGEKVKFFFRMYSINRHKMTTITPSYHAESYSPDDNRFDLRQFLYNVRWPWQFQRIDELVERIEKEEN